MEKNKIAALAGKGAAAALVATMAFGALPVQALAAPAQDVQASALGGAADAAASWQAGHSYEMPLSLWMNNQVDGATVNMTRYYSTTGKLTVAQDGTLDYQFTILAPDKFQGLQYGGKDVQPELVDGKAVYHLIVSAAELNNTTGIETRMRIDAMGGWFTMNIHSDVDKVTDVTPAKPSPSFSDVAEGTWYHDGVTFVASKGIMNGYSGSDRFGVDDVLTRAQFATLLYNYAVPGHADGSNTPNETGLPDVESGTWYTASVNWAVKNGIINGYTNQDGSRTFGPNDAVTLEQMLTIIANLKGVDVEGVDTSNLDQFSDKGDISEWAVKYVAWGKQVGLFNGSKENDATYARPRQDISRGRVAVVLKNAFDNGILK